VFIIWDRLFGTFREEKRKKEFYGLGNQLNSFNPFYANYQHGIRMLNIDLDDESTQKPFQNTRYPLLTLLRRTFELVTRRRVHHPLQVNVSALLMADLPSSLPEEVDPPPPGRVRYGSDLRLPSAVRLYSGVHFVGLLVQSVILFDTAPSMGYSQLIVHVLGAFLTTLSVNFLNEGNAMASVVETVRVAVLTFVLLVLASFPASRLALQPYLPFPVELAQEQYFYCALFVSVWWTAVHSMHFQTPVKKA
jgi:hypothetical protein